jgi:hypothetical protein
VGKRESDYQEEDSGNRPRITFHEATDYGKVRCKITKG